MKRRNEAGLPRPYETFKRRYPQIWRVYDRLGVLSHAAGPLSKKIRELVKLGMAIGARMEGAVHSHTRRAIDVGASPQEIRHLVLLAITTLGFPSTVTALTWVEDILKKSRPRKKQGK